MRTLIPEKADRISMPTGAEEAEGDAASSSVHLFTDLHTRAEALLGEFRSYQAHLKSQKKQQEVEVRAFKRGVESEVKTLEKLRPVFEPPHGTAHQLAVLEDGVESPQLHSLRSSNLPFYESVWNVAKSCCCVTSLGKKMYLTGKHSLDPGEPTNGFSAIPQTLKKGVTVDIVANNGMEWIKVSTLTEKRLLFEMAKEGWEKYGDYSGESDVGSSEDDGREEEDKGGKLELVRLAEDLKAAAQCVRIRFQHPEIRFVLPKIQEGVLQDVDAFLADLRATGAVVQCSTDMDQVLGDRQLHLDKLIPSIAVVPLTSTINVDCTMLLALISDISHLLRPQLSLDSASTSQNYHKAIESQIEAEESTLMLPGETYPLLAGRDLECTSHAAQRMREIVQCMGTPSERRRADILLGEGPYKDQSAPSLRQAFGEQSIHTVPDDLRLPVKVIQFDVQECLSNGLDPLAPHARPSQPFPISTAARAKDMLRLTPINASVFLYGWSHQITTFTSNRTVATELLKTINDILDSDERQGRGDAADFVGPLIYICETARSLIGKTKFK